MPSNVESQLVSKLLVGGRTKPIRRPKRSSGGFLPLGAMLAAAAPALTKLLVEEVISPGVKAIRKKIGVAKPRARKQRAAGFMIPGVVSVPRPTIVRSRKTGRAAPKKKPRQLLKAPVLTPY